MKRLELTEKQEKLEAPPAVGATLEESEVVFWFVSSDAKPFGDHQWILHPALLQLMREHGVRSRIEHIFRWQFKANKGPFIPWAHSEIGELHPTRLPVI